ncbi:MAG: hypothetical protein CVV64_12150 [Candidatus Wallbacteria bacterium HGW-Wallbacteria-1]|jgi:hypothetical protein|uniref:Uncharacterized protein n=1 Tax=Candidatus Wallbacteria bacterium HGW-Wallbacteria-1 TaxID=2013854 RepID=A0A2N1PNH9_9BACT|nr:MAG: hypothetical protein CVV64_12150 [Candidatus Wallbacteria bacterium HGW-Wallbacteria-1]
MTLPEVLDTRPLTGQVSEALPADLKVSANEFLTEIAGIISIASTANAMNMDIRNSSDILSSADIFSSVDNFLKGMGPGAVFPMMSSPPLMIASYFKSEMIRRRYDIAVIVPILCLKKKRPCSGPFSGEYSFFSTSRQQ